MCTCDYLLGAGRDGHDPAHAAASAPADPASKNIGGLSATGSSPQLALAQFAHRALDPFGIDDAIAEQCRQRRVIDHRRERAREPQHDFDDDEAIAQRALENAIAIPELTLCDVEFDQFARKFAMRFAIDDETAHAFEHAVQLDTIGADILHRRGTGRAGIAP